MLNALAYAHDRKCFHSDLKPENILINKNGEFKLGDLGICIALASTDGIIGSLEIGTLEYRPPESFENKPANLKGDIWAIGCIIYELTTGKILFNVKTR